MTSPLHETPFLVVEPGMHTAPISRLDADAAGRFLVTASLDKTVRVWAAADGRLLRTIRMPAGPGDVGKAYAVAISPDGETIAAGGWMDRATDNIYLFERRSGRMVGRLGGLESVVLHLAFSPDGRWLVACLGGANGIRVFEADAAAAGGWREALADRDYGDSSYWAAFAADGRLATTSYDGHVRLYGADLGAPRKVKPPGGSEPFGLAWSRDGGRLAVGYDDNGKVDILDGRSLEPLAGPETGDVGNGNLGSVAFSADGRRLLAGGTFDRNGDSPILAWSADGSGKAREVAVAQDTIMALRPLGDGRLAFAATDPRLGMLDADLEEIWNKGPSQADFRDQRSNLGVSADGRRLRFGYEPWGREASHLDLASRRLDHDPPADPDLAAPRQEAPGLEIEQWEDRTDPSLNGEPIRLMPFETSFALAIAPDAERFVLGTHWYLRAFDRSGAEQWNVPAPSTTWAVNITGDGRLVVAAFGDGTIRWYRLDDGEELLAFYPDGDRERWVAWTRQGYYMASPGGEELIGWQVNRDFDEAPEFYTASRFRDRFHRPDIVDLVLEELDVDKAAARANAALEGEPEAPEPEIEDLPTPPIVRILRPADLETEAGGDIELLLSLDSPPDDPPLRLKALVDGERMAEHILPPSKEPFEKRLLMSAAPGASQLIVIAENRHGWSDPATLRFKRAAQALHQPKATLYVLAVGVSAYAGHEHLRLRWAAQDAEDLVAVMEKQKGILYKNVCVLPLLDEDATQSGVLRGLAWLEREMTVEDASMILLAGHGTNDARGEFFFLPHDVRMDDQIEMRLSAIDHVQIKRTLASLADRGKTLLFLDCCHSGNVFEGARSSLSDMSRFADELAAAESGVAVFTSCSASEISCERDEWRNGAFTEALLEALDGKADDRDGYLRITDIADYVIPRVKQMTNGAQTPFVRFHKERYTNPHIVRVR